MDMNTPQVDTNLDVPFSQLFGSEGGDVQPTTATDANPQPQMTPSQEPQTPTQVTPTPQSFELKTKTGTVYKSVEDAIQGIEHKDTLISRLRHTVIEATGVDPLTGQPLQVQPQYGQPQYGQPQMQPQQQMDEGYLQNPQKYFQDLYTAYQQNDPQKYFSVQQKLIEEKTTAQFAPVVPLIQNFAIQGAVDRVASQLPDYKTFHGTQAFSETLQKFPALAQAIRVSESDLTYAHQLPDLYKMVYSLHQADRLPELVRQQTAANSPQPPARPTATPSQMTPPQQGRLSRNTNLTDANARKSIIDAFENSGKADATWR